ncbi:MAG: hypothetical protein IH942_09160 [Acidobacteria bacterium]|nr:hypothetical protein [Acidobacteriota bacterium]
MPDAARPTRFLVLGPLDAVGNGQEVALGGPKQRAVLGMLISRAGRQRPMISRASMLSENVGGATMLREHGFGEHVAKTIHAST